MSGTTGAGGTEAFARLLRELKDRSGLSYGALAQRMHMSTSTLHRYCNGTAVPVEYAPVERLARVCRATPQELVELHRRWILADAARTRGNKGPGSGGTGGKGADKGAGTDAAQQAGSAGSADAGSDDALDAVEAAESDGENSGPVVVDVPRTLAPPQRPRPPRGRRTVLVACVAAAAVLGAVVFTVRPMLGGGNGTEDQQAAGAPARATGTAGAGKASASPSPSVKGHKPSASASASATASEGAAEPGTAQGGRQGGARRADGGATGAVPLTVGIRPYVYDDPCSQHFLVDSEPGQVGPPAPNEQDAPRWAAAYGAVSSGEQRVALTVQGTGEETVVLEALHVRVLSKGAPLAWNDYSMGVGCGGGVDTKSFDIDLDNGSPTVTVKNGQRDFPYKVSESDPEVFYVTAHTKAHDVRWDLTLDWSSGGRHGTVHIDDKGTPFHTSADVNRPGYDYPLGGSEWIRRDG
ncbi:helix-turn-helix domain-containing protein [Streptomyces sp. NBC_00557]|uniref:helix-turn-helix domain-containing protein n=1 Tax=Streptomyces sp. NBC_00557 TaxID=2975776 RepID=UPI002E807D43|nr:helix-turn-helix transcriptional regulator [Streptomyces sp. NBC_00557]WUC35757.1 helix-turn-helix domain-containing protein [Streptomyces sp. NBC_00557]